MKKIIALLLIFVMVLSSTAAMPNNETGFTDVPKGHYFEESINKLKELQITYGIGNGAFGFNKEISRAEFLAFLVRLQNITLDSSANTEMFLDVKTEDWFYPYINIGLKYNIINKGEYQDNSFMPNKAITREEMAVMIVRAMEYDYLAAQVNNQSSQFKDVKQRAGYIELAKDLGIIYGRSKEIFDPAEKATKQEAAAMLIRMYNNKNNKLDMFNAFYAIKSFNQVDKIKAFDSVSYGWSRLAYNEASQQIELTTTKKYGGHPFYVPEDFQLALSDSVIEDTKKYLMVFGSNENYVTINGNEEKIVSLLFSNENAVDKLVYDLVSLTNNLSVDTASTQFDGIVIDFEGLKDNGSDKSNFVQFLTKLKTQLEANNKKLIVCINPPREEGQAFYNGYDFEAIGKLADYVILMAHDYEPKNLSSYDMLNFKGETPLAPIKDIYYGIKYTINNGMGVPKEKLLLQISFSVAQWQFINNVGLNNTPYTPDYDKIINRMRDANTNIKSFNYSDKYQSPYFVYEAEGVTNKIWYEDERSIAAKVKLANMFGLEGISVWRLGLIPDYPMMEDDSYNLNLMNYIESLNK